MQKNVKAIRKAVFPVAGLGTRFLPATRAVPKEMMTIVDRPALQYAVDEAREAGIEHFVFVTGRGKGVIEDHFDRHPELEETLRSRGKTAELARMLAEIPAPGETSFTRQQSPLGLGHAVWCARDIVGDEPFALLLPDMIHQGEPGCLARMVEAYRHFGGNHLAVAECDPSLAHQYGIVAVGEDFGDAFRIAEMVEKPAKGTAPSNLYISGRYILQPEVFGLLANQERGAGGEIQLTDAMLRLAREQPFHGVRFPGRIFDTGSKAGFLMANVAYALQRQDIAPTVLDDLKALLREAGG